MLLMAHLSPFKAVNINPTRVTSRPVPATSEGNEKEIYRTAPKMPMSPMRPASKRVAAAPSPSEPALKKKAVAPPIKPRSTVAPTMKTKPARMAVKPVSERSKPASVTSLSAVAKEPMKRTGMIRVERPKRESTAAVKRTIIVTKPKSGTSTWLTKGPAVRKAVHSQPQASTSTQGVTSEVNFDLYVHVLRRAHSLVDPEETGDGAFRQ